METDETEKTTKQTQGSRDLKKRKTSTAKDAPNPDEVADRSYRSWTKGKKGALKFMKEIPIDVLLEIFSQLEPIDLLHFSRVSKSLHDLLTSNNTLFVWKSVRLLLVFGQTIL
jgi:hypothetical protein